MRRYLIACCWQPVAPRTDREQASVITRKFLESRVHSYDLICTIYYLRPVFCVINLLVALVGSRNYW